MNEEMATEMIQNETECKRIKKLNRISELQDNIKESNMHATGVLEGEKAM